MAGRMHRRNERSTITYLLYSEDIARLISELLDATTDTDPTWRDQVLGLIRLALDLKRREQRGAIAGSDGGGMSKETRTPARVLRGSLVAATAAA
jgi:hypothetical protein